MRKCECCKEVWRECHLKDGLCPCCYDYVQSLQNQIDQLKQQLVEKEKELAYMTKQAKKLNNEAQKYYEDAYCNDAIYQDKISFAVEQLEKVKETSECILDNALKNSSLNESYYDRLLDEINNQIKQLKEMKQKWVI